MVLREGLGAGCGGWGLVSMPFSIFLIFRETASILIFKGAGKLGLLLEEGGCGECGAVFMIAVYHRTYVLVKGDKQSTDNSQQSTINENEELRDGAGGAGENG